MGDSAENLLLDRLVERTKAGRVVWREEVDGWFTAEIGGTFPARFRFLYFEATNQIGADPLAIQLMMPGWNGVYFAGTEGFQCFREILAIAFEGWRPAPDPREALRLLDEGLRERDSAG